MNLLSVTYEAGRVVEAPSEPTAAPSAFYLSWPEAGPMTLWYEGEDGEPVVFDPVAISHTPQTQASNPIPGFSIAHDSALLAYGWPESLFFVWTDTPTGETLPRLHIVDFFEGTHRRFDGGLNPDTIWRPFAHPNGRVYWTERPDDFERQVEVWSWDPVAGEPESVAQVSTGSLLQAWHRGNVVVFEDDFNLANAYVVDLATGGVSTRAKSSSSFSNRSTLGLATWPAEAADRFNDRELGGAYGYPSTAAGPKIRVALDSPPYRFSGSSASSSDADSAIDLASRPGSALRWNAARTGMAVYPYRGLRLGDYTLKWFHPAEPPDSLINSNPSQFESTIPRLDPDTPTTQPHQVWPWNVEPFEET